MHYAIMGVVGAGLYAGSVGIHPGNWIGIVGSLIAGLWLAFTTPPRRRK